jgi:MinD superfamily P-loop ATPase
MARKKKSAVAVSQGRQLPMLDERRCNGCGWCVRLCPTDCLEMAGPLPYLARPGHCNSCGVCAIVCPTEALTLEIRLTSS